MIQWYRIQHIKAKYGHDMRTQHKQQRRIELTAQFAKLRDSFDKKPRRVLNKKDRPKPNQDTKGQFIDAFSASQADVVLSTETKKHLQLVFGDRLLQTAQTDALTMLAHSLTLPTSSDKENLLRPYRTDAYIWYIEIDRKRIQVPHTDQRTQIYSLAIKRKDN
jgi:hypothetical protein